VKTTKNHIKKGFILMLLLAYVFSVSAYVVFHPKHTGASVLADSPHLYQHNNQAGSYNQLHGVFKSTVENRVRTKSFSIATPAIVFALVFSVFAFSEVFKKHPLSFDPVFDRPRHNYLTLRTIRI
jgi:hypothetical protein